MDANTRIENIRNLLANTHDMADKATLIDILAAFGEMTVGQKSKDLPNIIGASPARCDDIFDIGSACLRVTMSMGPQAW
jgi:hypothetical protein